MFRTRDRLKFYLERWIQRGAQTQLLFIAAVIVGIALMGGLIAWLFSPQFDDPGGAIWWAFLRLTDPGYLGDDEGALLRTLSTIITLLGYVVFLGSLVAILTQWLNQTMRKLESGLTPITVRNHVLILGWTNRTPTIVQELMLSEGRVRRFLSRRGIQKLRIVILAEEVNRELMLDLRETLGSRWREHRVILRSGTSLRMEHLRRVSYRNASVIIVPGADFLLGGATATDARVIKTLISLSPHDPELQTGPAVVAEIFDASKAAVAESAYRGGPLDVVASDAFVSRLIAQNIRHQGLSYIYAELLSHRSGNELYVRSLPAWSGRAFGELEAAIDQAVVLGVVRDENGRIVPYLNPPHDWMIEDGDRLVFVASSYEECTASPSAAPREAVPPRAPAVAEVLNDRRILVLGWSHKVKALIDELEGYEAEHFEVDVLSRVPVADRESALDRLPGGGRLQIRHLAGDYTVRDILVQLNVEAYHNVVFLASDWLDTEEETDARTILGYVILKDLLEGRDERPEVLIELMDPENARLFRRRAGEVIISPVILSHILAHVSLRRELNVVFNELFGPGGAEFFFHPASSYGLELQPTGMRAIRQVVASRNRIALGVRIRAEFDRRGGGVYLNPPADRMWTLQPEDEIVVLSDT